MTSSIPVNHNISVKAATLDDIRRLVESAKDAPGTAKVDLTASGSDMRGESWVGSITVRWSN